MEQNARRVQAAGRTKRIDLIYSGPRHDVTCMHFARSQSVSNNGSRDGEVPSQKELSSYFEELFSSKVPRQKELSSSNEELFPNPE